MKELYIAAIEELEAELDREATDAECDTAYQRAVDRLVDHADALRKAARENGE